MQRDEEFNNLHNIRAPAFAAGRAGATPAPPMDTPAPLNPALLPAGLRDLLPPDAETEAASVEAVMAVFAAHGYDRVKPPLLEFEESFLGGSGAAVADQSFRIMDPDSHRMMVLRADMTPQIARIAATRLAGAPRPLRLAYAGQCVRVRGVQGTDRQVPQVGVELIGADSVEADAEVMLVAAEALVSLGIDRISLDLTLPTLAPALLDDASISGAQRVALSRALDRKDAAAVAEHGGALAPVLLALLMAAGPASAALPAVAAATLPPACQDLADRLADVVRRLTALAPHVRLTVDPLEFRGFRYHTGLAITVFAAGRHEELGRGGRYMSGEGEPATGLTLYADAVLRAAPRRVARQRVLLPQGADPLAAHRLRQQGFATVALLAPEADVLAEARRLNCSHVLHNGAAQPEGVA
jgi:ATP phosphoribosyltransferase regulatory subunit